MIEAPDPKQSAISPACWGKSELLKKLLLAGKMGNLEAVRLKYKKGVIGRIPWTDFEREWNFWAHITYSEFGCWNWRSRAQITLRSRPRVAWGGTYITVSRIAKMITAGPIQDELHVCHACDNPACVRPDHLFLGTPTDNMRDMASKGRNHVMLGRENKAAKLDEEAVRAIRVMLQDGTPKTEIALEFGVTPGAIHLINVGRNWRWLK